MENYAIEINTLWNSMPEGPQITAYIPHKKTSNCAIAILPGGAYYFRAEHEGKGYAEFFAKHGIISFVVDYRCLTDKFPIPLLDARRSIQFIRYHSKKYGVDPSKIAIMGSSAGGHLAALTSTYNKEFAIDSPDEIDRVSFSPNAQILCYPVIKLFGKGITHLDSGRNLLGDQYAELAEELSPDLIVTEETPQAFIWHTFEDKAVNVINSLDYARSLRNCGVATELHVFPDGYHGLGLATENNKTGKHVAKWSQLLLEWLVYIGFCSNDDNVNPREYMN